MGPDLTLGTMSQLNNIEPVNSLACPSGLSSEGILCKFQEPWSQVLGKTFTLLNKQG